MKRTRQLILLFTLLLVGYSYPSFGQLQFGFTMPKNVNKVEIPFQEVNNLIVIPIIVNNVLALNFILDSGVDTPILTELALAHALNVEHVREVVINVPGVQDSVRAYIGQKVNFKLPGNIVGHNMNLLVLQEDYLNLSEKMGLKVYGILGYDLFSKFVVEINYDSKLLTLYRPESYVPKARQKFMHLEVANSKSYLKPLIHQSKEADTLRLLVDTGASHSILLDLSESSIQEPKVTVETSLGTGLGGAIPGRVGRIPLLQLNDFQFKNAIASFPDPDAYGQLIKRGSRQGTIGGDMLSRLHPVFDYSNNKVYFTKGNRYKSKFEFDMTGLAISTKGSFLDSLYVDYVRPNSPADEVGLSQGDIVLSMNGYNLSNTTFAHIQSLMRKKPNYKLRIKYLRDNIKRKTTLKLKRAI